MELTVNSFGKGLQMDTNPLVLGNESLTDALNATFITMNGNEVILLNDMGNRRIDHAFLPSGYTPVGIKEYGGIIYVASYNPLTNRSQIGSFPSPERNMGEEYPDLKAEINDNLYQYFIRSSEETKDSYHYYSNNDDEYKTKIRLTSSDSILLELAKGNTIHPGDKYTVYVKENITWFNSEYISNFNNTTDNKIITPKNKQYTLSLGVLNSLNEFVDITKNLLRWEEKGEEGNKKWQLAEELEDKSELYKFNYGYFIPNLENITDIVGQLSLDEESFFGNRLTKGVNTYAYKLVGPLYLKIQLNRILSFNYAISGDVVNENLGIYYIYIDGELTYNCPDPFTGGEGDEDYDSYQNLTYLLNNIITNSGYIEQFGFSLFTPNKNSDSGDDKELRLNVVLEEKSSTFNNNLYTTRLTKRFVVNVNPNYSDKTKYPYAVGVPTFTYEKEWYPNLSNSNRKYYLKDFWQEGTIDLTKLGTGLIELVEWRFYNDWDETTTDENEFFITCNFNIYPKRGLKFSNLEICISTDAPDSNSHWVKISDIVGRISNKKLKWSDFELESLKMYWVYARCNNSLLQNIMLINNGLPIGFFLTTNLFDECYFAGNEDFVSNFNRFSKRFSNEDSDIVNKYTKVNLTPDFDVTLLSDKKVDNKNVKLLMPPTDNNQFIQEVSTTHNIQASISNVRVCYDEIKYPSDLFTTLNISGTPTYNITGSKSYGIIGLDKDILINIVTNGNTDSLKNTLFSKYGSSEKIDINESNSIVTKEIKLPLYFISRTINLFTLKNVFVKIGDALDNMFKNEDYRYAGFLSAFNEHGTNNPDDKKIYILFPKYNNNNLVYFESKWRFKCPSDMTPKISNSNNDVCDYPLFLDNAIKGDFESCELLKEGLNDLNGWEYLCLQDDINNAFFKHSNTVGNFSFLFINPARCNYSEITAWDSENHMRFYGNKVEKRRQSDPLMKENTFLFWKMGQQEWALYPELIKYNAEKNPLTKLFEDKGLSNLYYAYWNTKEIIPEDNKIRSDVSNYIYTENYNIPLSILFKVSGINVTSQIKDDYKKDGDKFRVFTSDTKNNSEKTRVINLSADALSQNIIDKLLIDTYSNLTMDGTFLDNENKALDVSKFYYNNDSSLTEVINNKSIKVGVNSLGATRDIYPMSVISDRFPQWGYLVCGLGTEGSIDSNHTIRINFKDAKLNITNYLLNFSSMSLKESEKPSSNTVVDQNTGSGGGGTSTSGTTTGKTYNPDYNREIIHSYDPYDRLYVDYSLM